MKPASKPDRSDPKTGGKTSNRRGHGVEHTGSSDDGDGQPDGGVASSRDELRLVAHRLLAELESERGDVSRLLDDQIAQMLLGIGVRLAAMQQEAKVDVDQLIEEILSTKRSAAQSAASAQRIAKRSGSGSGSGKQR